MKILAIEQEVPGIGWSTVSKELLAQEALHVYRMYLKDQLREHYFNEANCAVLVLECDSKAQAGELLGKLPLVEKNLISFQIMELRPYTGYDRIIQSAADIMPATILRNDHSPTKTRIGRLIKTKPPPSMRKLVLFMHLSLDGFAADPNHGLDFLTYDAELQAYADELVKTVGSPVYGRVTYELMAGYWPTVLSNPDADKRSLEHARWVEAVPKIVFSRTLNEAGWNNTRLIKDNVADEVAKLKGEPGKDLVIFGSPGLSASLMNMGLIDEYRLTVHPIILGSGISVFTNNTARSSLKLLEAKTLKSGVVTLHYATSR